MVCTVEKSRLSTSGFKASVIDTVELGLIIRIEREGW